MNVEPTQNIVTLPKGTVISVLAYSKGSLKVQVDSTVGYLNYLYLRQHASIDRLILAGKEQDDIEFRRSRFERIRKSEARIDSVLEENKKDIRKTEAKEQAAQDKLAEKKRAKRKQELIGKYGPELGTQLFNRDIRLGMTSEMVQDAIGRPEDINRTVLSSGVHEQWVYKGGVYYYFEDGVLTGWQD